MSKFRWKDRAQRAGRLLKAALAKLQHSFLAAPTVRASFIVTAAVPRFKTADTNNSGSVELSELVSFVN